MAFGTLAFDTLQTSDSKNTGTNKTLDTSFVFNGTPKAWASINEVTTVSIFDSFNLSSTTDDGSGRTDFVLANVMSNHPNVFLNPHNISSGSFSLMIRNFGPTVSNNLDISILIVT